MPEDADIVFIEDNANDIELMKHALLKAGSQDSLAILTDGEQATAYLSERISKGSLPSLIITDLKLPRKDGHELVEWMRRQSGLAQIPIVVLTSSDEKQDIDRAISLGANAFIQKPLGLSDLVKIVQSLLASWVRRKALK